MSLEEIVDEDCLINEGFKRLRFAGLTKKYYYRVQKVFKCKVWQYEIIMYQQIAGKTFKLIGKWYKQIPEENEREI